MLVPDAFEEAADCGSQSLLSIVHSIPNHMRHIGQILFLLLTRTLLVP
jgi:hypothetical protein